MLKTSAKILIPLFILTTLFGNMELLCCCYKNHEINQESLHQKIKHACCAQAAVSIKAAHAGSATQVGLTGTCKCGQSKAGMVIAEESLRRIEFRQDTCAFEFTSWDNTQRSLRGRLVQSNITSDMLLSGFDVIYQRHCVLRI